MPGGGLSRKEVQEIIDGFEARPDRKIDGVEVRITALFILCLALVTITKDAIFDYVYGVLHASAYRERFANDLAKELPRIPLAPDFHAFAKAGRELAELHLGYETCEEYSLEVAFAHSGDPRPAHFRIGDRVMRFAEDEKTVLAVNEHVSLHGIPDLAHTYQVNGRTPLEWFIDSYRITQDQTGTGTYSKHGPDGRGPHFRPESMWLSLLRERRHPDWGLKG